MQIAQQPVRRENGIEMQAPGRESRPDILPLHKRHGAGEDRRDRQQRANAHKAAPQRQPGAGAYRVAKGVNKQERHDQQRNHRQPGIRKQSRAGKKRLGIADLDDEQRGDAQHHGQALETQMRMDHLRVPKLGTGGTAEPFLQEEQEAEQGRAEHADARGG